MDRRVSLVIAVVLIAAGSVHGAATQGSEDFLQSASPHRAVLNRYCVTCHNDKLKTAGLMLDRLDSEKIGTGTCEEIENIHF